MRNELWGITLSTLIGLCLGACYFGGLWYTIRRMTTARRPTMALAVSFVARAALALTVVLVLLWAPWGNPAACLLGIVAARLAVGRWVAVATH